ncbi:MAG TPA: PepSY domain-containing protein, partial [Rhizomicrobium sp.]|nr:PepSY domain-containing protein [Rhizomicrobium sp.]
FGAILLTAMPGLGFAQTPMTDAQIQQKLQSEGYTNVKITEHDKSHIDVTATKDGKTEKLAVNRSTGAVAEDDDKD